MERNEHESPPRPSSGRIEGLDGLRAISIMMVLVAHASNTIPRTSPMQAVVPYLGNASLGVFTFFVISGYLITYLLRKEWNQTGRIDLKAFYIRRALRIFPAFYAFLLVVVMLHAAGLIQTSYSTILCSGLFLNNYISAIGVPLSQNFVFIEHFWTLSMEEQFYLFWPAVILVVGLVRAPRLAFLIILAIPTIRVASYFLWPGVRTQLGHMLHTAGDPIMIGCLAALLEGWPPFERALQRLSSWIWPLLAVLFLFGLAPWLKLRFAGKYSASVGIALDGLVVAFLLLWVVRRPASLLGRVLSTPALRHIGVLSYSLYLWQQLFLTPENQTWTGVFPINLLVSLLVAEISYYALESPFLKLRSRFRARPTGPAASRVADQPAIVEPAL